MDSHRIKDGTVLNKIAQSKKSCNAVDAKTTSNNVPPKLHHCKPDNDAFSYTA